MTTSITILLADDHAVVRAGIRQFLESAVDLSVIAEADDGDSARRLIAKHRPDVAVLDVQMPKSTGIEVARWCRSAGLEVEDERVLAGNPLSVGVWRARPVGAAA